VYHVGGTTTTKKKNILNFRNSLMLTKTFLKINYIQLLGRMVLDGIAGMQFLVTGKFKHFVAILKAHFFVLQTFFSSL
jgi:hypothetical protein